MTYIFRSKFSETRRNLKMEKRKFKGDMDIVLVMGEILLFRGT